MTTNRRRTIGVAAVLSALTLALGACGSGAGSAEPDGKINVVASTNVWAGVVNAVGGERVSVTSIIDDPAGDPHSYESTASDGLAVADAKLIIYNGGGYDDFAQRLAEQAGDVPVIEAFAISGHGEKAGHAGEEAGHAEEEAGHAGEEAGHDHGANEHVWYDLPTVAKVADRVAEDLGKAQPEHAQEFAGRAKAFKAELDGLAAQLAEIGSKHPGSTVLATEPVAHYLLDGAKLTDGTPAAFSRAIEGETDVPVAAQDQMFRLIEGKRVAAVINNPQTETPVTAQVLVKARNAGVPVVDITETLPEGVTDYLKWVKDQVDALAAAVNR